MTSPPAAAGDRAGEPLRDRARREAGLSCNEHCVGEYISRCPMSRKGLHCQVSKLFNSDTRPRPTTGRARGRPLSARPGHHEQEGREDRGKCRPVVVGLQESLIFKWKFNDFECLPAVREVHHTDQYELHLH